MNINEPYQPHLKSIDISMNLTFALARISDLEKMVDIMLERTPSVKREKLVARTKREIEHFSDGRDYGLFTAKLKNEVIGFCRYYHSSSIPAEKVIFSSPVGFYAMGINILTKFRRKGVAKFLAYNREEWLKKRGAEYFYSCVALDNLSSQRMHESFGFKQIGIVPGALTVKFDAGEGILYKKSI